MNPEEVDLRQQAVDTKAAKIGKSAIPFGQLIRRFSPEPIPRIPGILPGEEQAKRIFVTAPSKSLKTWFVYEMVYTLGTGENFLGEIELVHGEWTDVKDEYGDIIGRKRIKLQGFGEPLRTLYLQMENTEYSMEVRGRAIAEGHGQDVDPDDEISEEDFIMIVPRMELNLLDSVDVDAVISVAKDYDILVMDSTYNMVPRTLNDDEVAKGLTRTVNRLVDEGGVTVVAIHHTSTKGDGFLKGRESMGSTFFTSAFWDHEIRLNYDRDDRVLNVGFVSRDTDFDELQFRFAGPPEPGAPRRGMWELVDLEAEAREGLNQAVNLIRDWVEDDPNNLVYEVGNGAVKIRGQFTKQGDLAVHLGLTQSAMKLGLKHYLDLQKSSHGPSV